MYLAHRGDVKQAALKFHIGDSTAYELIKEVSTELHNILGPLYAPMPTKNEWLQIANNYEQLWNFPNCIGALDGKHINIEKPASSGSCFWSYKKKHTFVLMAIADAHKHFIWYSLGDFGSLNDASIFGDTDFAFQLANNELDIPPPRELPNTDIKVPFMFVADEIFKLSENIMKSYSKTIDLPVPEKVFNYRLKRARLCIECAFGMLTEKFHVLQEDLKFDLMTSQFMVSAMACLHNFLITTNRNINLDSRNGSLNDASIFGDTDFAFQLANNELDIPPPRELPNTDIKVPFMFVADEIFKLSENIMKSYSKIVDLPVPEKVFNYRLKRARLCIECAFGMLTEKFHVLQEDLKFDLMTSQFMVSAMACLHNFLIITNRNINLDNRNGIPVHDLENERNRPLQMTPIQQRHNNPKECLREKISKHDRSWLYPESTTWTWRTPDFIHPDHVMG
ncbi:hypothetical protein TSAR_003973 [Trichomalopsis sarcophagae]|uniref:DDE Tnp4 domain-containing protein n=1 Tax=Trichomalopsis sarcophagae TaxID=543379 RepID=A0A232EJM9_9HYME|nr:hypothetical protein TSAR_003973 [Trichomalopsis sarcophagae]